MEALTLYLRLLAAGIRGQMQYKASFALAVLGLAVISSLDFAVVAVLLSRFRAIGGWSLPEIALLYGLSGLALGLADTFARGFDQPFGQMMQRGTFDSVLVRPVSAFVQVAATDFRLSRLGRALQAGTILIWALAHLPIAWDPIKALLLPMTIASGATIYLSLIVVGATICFWTVKQPEVVSAFTFGGNLLVSYPLSIYSDWLRATFLFVIPVGFSNYPAALWLVGRTAPGGPPAAVAFFAPLVAAAFLALALWFWQVGLRRYQGSGN